MIYQSIVELLEQHLEGRLAIRGFRDSDAASWAKNVIECARTGNGKRLARALRDSASAELAHALVTEASRSAARMRDVRSEAAAIGDISTASMFSRLEQGFRVASETCQQHLEAELSRGAGK